MKSKAAGIFLAIAICLLSLSEASATKVQNDYDVFISNMTEPSSAVFDTVINNARLVNPETNSDLSGINIGILNGRVASITYSEISGKQSVNATGLVAAPGFIDIDSYDPNAFGVRYKLADGVTTNLAMHGGTPNAKQWYARYANSKPLINYGASSFLTQIRSSMGYGTNAVMTNPAHIEKLCALVEANIKEGALGISASPEYAPGVQEAELLALSELAAKHKVTTYYHLRYSTTVEPNTSIKAIKEVINYAEQTGASVHILHITSTGSTYCVEEAFDLIDEARERGLDITADLYPYDSWATYLGSARFSSGWQSRFGLTYNDLQIPNSAERLTESTFAKYKNSNQLVIAIGSIPEDEVIYALKQPYVFIASDTIIGNPSDSHPRGAGSYSRLVGKYSRDEGVIDLIEAIAKASYLPARRLESASPDMKKKGRIELGADADIVLFDYNTIIDKATNENVAAFSAGVKYVFVNGLLTYDNGRFATRSAARPVLSYFKSPEVASQAIDVKLTNDKESLIVSGYRIYGNICVDLKQIGDVLDIPYEFNSDGSILFGQVELCVGNRNGGYQKSNIVFSSEPVIFGGKVYFNADDVKDIIEKNNRQYELMSTVS